MCMPVREKQVCNILISWPRLGHYRGPYRWSLSHTMITVPSGPYRCETSRKSNFLKNGKMVISVKIRNFFRSWMTKRTSPLESSQKSSYHVEFFRIPR